MKHPHRRHVLHQAAGAAVLPIASHIGWAQTYQSRPVRIIVGFSAERCQQQAPLRPVLLNAAHRSRAAESVLTWVVPPENHIRA
jgi:hypothetical protein